MERRKLYRDTLGATAVLFGLLAGLLFGVSGTVHFWRGWLFWLTFCTPTLIITLYFLRRDPALIARRVNPVETRPRQIAGQAVAAVLFFGGILVLPALDHRNGWSFVPPAISMLADGLVAAGFVLVFFVFRENTFASRAVEHMEDQRVVTTGPYAVVRHPMYSGAILIIAGAPPAIGSLWGLIPAAVLTGLIVLRLLDEENELNANLEGYPAYCRARRYRLIPHIW